MFLTINIIYRFSLTQKVLNIMIKLSPVNYNINLNKSFCGNEDISDLVAKGDKALNEGKFSDALKIYQEANGKNPQNYDLYRKMGKANFQLKDYKSAEDNFNIFLEKNPDNAECLIDLGEAQRMRGLYTKALSNFESALELEPDNDLAKRSLLETQNNILSVYAPERAYKEKMEYARKNLKEALNMAVKFMGADYMKALKDVNIMFGKTASMSGTANIAQYEKKEPVGDITVSDSYIYASPQVIAAYLVHESVHGHDNDAYTSVREEQDAYEVAAKFWIKNSKGVKDPEMDYASGLYKKSPSALRQRVAQIYTMRDPDIAMTSPNHPPKKLFNFNKAISSSAASQSLQQYDVIA